MRKEDVLKLPSMPAASPTYPAGPYRFIDREFLVITYETDPALIRAQLPEPLEPIEHPRVHYEWIKMPDSSGFGSYTESGMVIPATLRGEEVNFVAQTYLDDDPPIAGPCPRRLAKARETVCRTCKIARFSVRRTGLPHLPSATMPLHAWTVVAWTLSRITFHCSNAVAKI
jgi:acetoacetate decarboxylase